MALEVEELALELYRAEFHEYDPSREWPSASEMVSVGSGESGVHQRIIYIQRYLDKAKRLLVSDLFRKNWVKRINSDVSPASLKYLLTLEYPTSFSSGFSLQFDTPEKRETWLEGYFKTQKQFSDKDPSYDEPRKITYSTVTEVTFYQKNPHA